MNAETYINLMRIADKRLIRARITGDMKQLDDACRSRQKIIDEYAKEKEVKREELHN